MKTSECELNFGESMSESRKNDESPSNDKHILPFQSLEYANGGVANPRSIDVKKTLATVPLIIVIEPTKDLAQQTYQTFRDLSGQLTDIQCQLMIGGQVKDYNTNEGVWSNTDIIIGTSGKIASCLCSESLDTSRCKLLILDEADQIAKDKSWTNAVYTIFSTMRTGQSAFDRLQVAFFSATLQSRPVKDLAKKVCHRPLYVDLRERLLFPDTIHECILNVEPQVEKVPEGVVTDAVHRGGRLENIIDLNCLCENELKSELVKLLKPNIVRCLINDLQMHQVLIFCRSSLDCDLLGQYLDKMDKRVCRILAGSSKSTEERKSNLMLFQNGGCQVLLCTDAGARGLNIDGLPYVINFTLPDKPETYVHRIGRVGRADKMGLAISLVSTVKEKVWFCQNGIYPPCSDTSIFQKGKGGNCIWYNEHKLLKEINTLAKRKSATNLTWPTLEWPIQIRELLEKGGYGRQKENPDRKQIQDIYNKVKEIETIQFKLQGFFYDTREMLKNLPST